MATDMTLFENAVDQVILDSERLHNVVNGSAVEEVITEDGSTIPTIRKAMLDNLYFKTPPLPWSAGAICTVFNQLYAFKSAAGAQWFYAPSASANNPIRLPEDPTQSGNWRLFLDSKYMEDYYAPKESPIFTGNPQCPTAPLESSDETLANTSFVHQLVRSQILDIKSGTLNLTGLNVSTQVKTNLLSVTGDSSFSGLVDARGSQGMFRQVTLTEKGSTLDFSYRNPLRPSELPTLLDYHSVTTDIITSHKIINGSTSADNDIMSMECLGNNRFDYVYITGSGAKGSNEPTLTVSGITKLENVVITGSVQGIPHSVDGMDILPNSVSTKRLTVTEALTVRGAANFAGINTNTLSAEGALTANTVTGVEGGFTTLTVSSEAVVNGNLGVEGSTLLKGTLGISGGVTMDSSLTVNGSTVFGGSSGTTTVHNLNITGSVTGLTIDLTGTTITPNAVLAEYATISGSLSAASANISSCILTKATVTKMEFTPVTLQSSVDIVSGTFKPDGNTNMYVINVDSNFTLGAWEGVTNPGTEEEPRPKPFSAIIYLVQDATGGHTVALDEVYTVVSGDAISSTANSVTILQLTYAGIDGYVDVCIANRPLPRALITTPDGKVVSVAHAATGSGNKTYDSMLSVSHFTV